MNPMKTLLAVSSLVFAGLLTVTAGCAVTDKQSTVGQYVDDATITARVKTRFAEDKQVDAMHIQVETLNGEVQLAGFATSDNEKARAAEVASNVPDVKKVRNNIIVRPPTR